MKLIKRIFILILAAALGAAVYVKLKVVDNVAAVSVKASHHSSTPGVNQSFEGGIGPVGNPYSPKRAQKKIY